MALFRPSMNPSPDSPPIHPASATTLAELFALQARVRPRAPAIRTPGQAPIDFSALNSLVTSGADSLARFGIAPRDRVAIVLRNGPWMAAAFASIAATTACAPLNPDYREAEFEFYLSDLQARLLVVEAGVDSPARNVARRLGIRIADLVPDTAGGCGSFRLEGGDPSGAPPSHSPSATDVALLLHTSGTTSRPKLVPLSHANLLASASHISHTLRLDPDDGCLNVMPLFHIHGLVAAALSSWWVGASVWCTPGWDADGFFQNLREPGVTWYTAVPTIHQSILAAARSGDRPLVHSLRFVRSSSSALPVAVFHGLESLFGVPVIEAYGMTEAAHQMCSNSLPPGIRKPGSIGLPAGPEVAVMDTAGSLLGPGVTGEIVIRGPNVTAGYDRNPAATEAAFTHGWFRTGDQGYRDVDGYFFLTGRLKEMINRGGEKVAPREIDEAMLSHPAVAQAVAFAVPHPRLGEDVAVAIVLHAGAQADDRSLRRHALDRLAPQKVPSRFLVVDSIPKGTTGKVLRLALFSLLAPHFEVGYIPPQNDIEQAIASVWLDILKCPAPGRFDNFFSLGGDSLLAARALSRLGSMFDLDLPIGSLFRNPTLAEQAECIEALLIDEIERSGEAPST
jgi:oxalate---CoA ligase